MLVAFFPEENQGDMTQYAFGWTEDVSTHGTSVHAQSNHIPAVGTRLILMVVPERQNTVINSDVPIQINGKVTWKNSREKKFGVKFT